MATPQKSTLRTEAYFSEDGKHRYLLRKEWEKGKKKAMVIMINPSAADNIVMDHTTMFVVNNLARLGFGSVDIVNMFSKGALRLSMKEGMGELIGDENDEYIKKSAARADCIVIAWGSIGNSSTKIKNRQKEIFAILKGQEEKIHEIADQIGRRGFHPLSPSVRKGWKLEKLAIDVDTEQEEQKEEEAK